MPAPRPHLARISLAARLDRRRATFFIAKPNRDDLAALRELIDAGHVRPVIERRYALTEIGEAMRAMADGHARGKHVVTLP